MKQMMIDFCEARAHYAGFLSCKRAYKYGDRSLPWRWTFWQEGFWGNLSWLFVK